jgi:hypothetical protein
MKQKFKVRIFTFLPSLFVLGFLFFLVFQTLTFFKENSSKISPELAIKTYSGLGLGKGKMIAASCAFTLSGAPIPETGQGHFMEFADCNGAVLNCPGFDMPVPGTSQCGGVCHPKPATLPPGCRQSCADGACETYCDQCTAGYVWTGQNCRLQNPPTCPALCTEAITPTVFYSEHSTVSGNVYIYPVTNARPTPGYSLGNCSTPLPTKYIRRCEIARSSSDGTNNSSWVENYDTTHTTWSGQPVKVFPYTESIQVRCGIFDTTTNTYVSLSGNAIASAMVPEETLPPSPCSATNACGETVTGTKNAQGVCSVSAPPVQSCSINNSCGETFYGKVCGGVCDAGQGLDLNANCIRDFKVTSERVNPDGSVEFSWKVRPGVDSKCSFVDLTVSPGRPIPGLQDLSPSTDRARINNIQATTRFCLVCKFFNLNTSAYLGEVVKHQWIKVLRIGEN